MTPQNKASQLVEKYAKLTANYFDAKECAIIAVNEVLSFIEGQQFLATERFYKEVIEELRKP